MFQAGSADVEYRRNKGGFQRLAGRDRVDTLAFMAKIR